MRMLPGQVEIAGRHLEMAMNEVHQPMRQIARKIRTVVSRPIFLEAARDVHTRVRLGGQLNVGIRFVVAQQDVVARLVLLDQVVFKRQRLFFVVDLNDLDVPGFADQRAGLDVSQAIVIEVAANAAAQVFGFTNVDDGPVGVLVEIDSRQQRQLGSLFAKLGWGVDSSIFAPVSNG